MTEETKYDSTLNTMISIKRILTTLKAAVHFLEHVKGRDFCNFYICSHWNDSVNFSYRRTTETGDQSLTPNSTIRAVIIPLLCLIRKRSQSEKILYCQYFACKIAIMIIKSASCYTSYFIKIATHNLGALSTLPQPWIFCGYGPKWSDSTSYIRGNAIDSLFQSSSYRILLLIWFTVLHRPVPLFIHSTSTLDLESPHGYLRRW